MTYDEALAAIRTLKPNQFDAFSRICAGDDSCLAAATAKALQKRGLINYELKPAPYDSRYAGLQMSLWRADVASLAVHRAWCAVCSERIKKAGVMP